MQDKIENLQNKLDELDGYVYNDLQMTIGIKN